MSTIEVRHGDCIELMRELPDNSIDSIVTDPPYGLEFMGKEWDAPWKSGTVLHDPSDVGGFQDGNGGNAFSRSRIRYGREGAAMLGFQAWFTEVAIEALRVLKPGGYLLAFGGTRTYHRLAVAIEDAGFEIRDSILWLYGSGFPKSHDVSKAIDKAAGAERKVVGSKLGLPGYSMTNGKGGLYGGKFGANGTGEGECKITAPATPAAQKWSGWGTALKPAHEPIVVARKPLDGTVAENVLTWGVGAMNIDGCRIGTRESEPQCRPFSSSGVGNGGTVYNARNGQVAKYTSGRWPANVVLSHTIFCGDTCADGCPVAELDRQSGRTLGGRWNRTEGLRPFSNDGKATNYTNTKSDTTWGGASRFFYVAKASKRERPRVDGVAHPTVKPLSLMRWLVRLVTPVGATVLEPFAGSGTTVEAALLEGCNILALEKNAEYLPLIQERMQRVNT
jgi:site-specific DNA-methyltransferase (adenine-specific)